MLLSMSAKASKQDVDIKAVLGGERTEHSGVPHGKELTAFAEAVASRDEAGISRVRASLVQAVGNEAMVDAAAVAANFQRMTRIADCTGIPLDAAGSVLTKSVRDELGLQSFSTSQNTKKMSMTAKLISAVLSPVIMTVMPMMARRKAKRKA